MPCCLKYEIEENGMETDYMCDNQVVAEYSIHGQHCRNRLG